MKKTYAQWFWFIGGFAVGFTLISIGHAALPKKVVAPVVTTPTSPAAKGQSNLSELQVSKTGTPDFENDFNKLQNVESRFAENADQQKKLKTATATSKKYKSRN